MYLRLPSPTGHKAPAPAHTPAADARADWTPLLAHAELSRRCSARSAVAAVFSPRQAAEVLPELIRIDDWGVRICSKLALRLEP